jgi:CrcB protein
MGVAIGLFESVGMNPVLRSLLATGFLGALTTFSTFSLETVSLLRAGYTGTAMLNLFASVLVGLLAIIAGFYLVRLAVPIRSA